MDAFCQEKVIHPEARKTVISISRPPDTRHRHLPCPACSFSLPPFQPYKKQPSISNRILMNSGSILGACWVHVRFICSSNFQQTRESEEYIPTYIYLYIQHGKPCQTQCPDRQNPKRKTSFIVQQFMEFASILFCFWLPKSIRDPHKINPDSFKEPLRPQRIPKSFPRPPRKPPKIVLGPISDVFHPKPIPQAPFSVKKFPFSSALAGKGRRHGAHPTRFG